MIKIGFRAIFIGVIFKIEVGDFLLKGMLLKIESVYFFKISVGNSRLRRNFLRSFRFLEIKMISVGDSFLLGRFL